ncbi:bifunctional riboflavin kinase/FMN phosphatase-like, partial [Thalictrum thalictroides]
MSCCCSNTNTTSCNGDTKILAVILDLDGTLLNTEKATKHILKEFLERYGKVVDRDEEDKRLGMMHMEAVTSIVKDYDLPLTPDQFSKEIMPLYHQKWPLAKPLPGANRLIIHLHKHGVPFALASNSITRNIENKISHQRGWKESFSTVLGSDQVNFGKPSPD